MIQSVPVKVGVTSNPSNRGDLEESYSNSSSNIAITLLYPSRQGKRTFILPCSFLTVETLTTHSYILFE